MNPTTWWATTVRVLQQLVADRRTMALMLAVPAVLLVLLYFVYLDVPTPPGQDEIFPHIALTLLGVLPMMVMFLVTSISMQRERVNGALERLWTTRLHRADLLFGYAAGFACAAVGQSVVMCTVAWIFLGIETAGSVVWVVLTATLGAVVGVATGLLTSAFARSEFQAVQFMPIVVTPQFFLCGLLVPNEQLPGILQWCAAAMPMTYAVDALELLRTDAEIGRGLLGDLGALVGFGVVCLGLASVTMPRRSR